MNIPEDINILIAKECAGEFEASERNKFVSWIESSSENADLYAESKSYIDAVNRFAKAQSTDVNEAWKSFQEKKEGTKIVPISKPRKINEFLKVAAVFLALVGVVKVVDLMMGDQVES